MNGTNRKTDALVHRDLILFWGFFLVMKQYQSIFFNTRRNMYGVMCIHVSDSTQLFSKPIDILL